MTIRYVRGALIAAAMTGGVIAGFGVARAQDTSALPKGKVTLVGCYLRVMDKHHHSKYVLAQPKLGPATPVHEALCALNADDSMVELDNVHGSDLDHEQTGVWMEIDGELGRVRDGDDLRKFDVKTFRAVPVEPRVAVIPRPAPPPQVRVEPPAPTPTPAPEPAPAPTSGIEPAPLPKTASPLPVIALLGFAAIGAALILRLLEPPGFAGR